MLFSLCAFLLTVFFLCVLSSYVYLLYYVCIAVLTLDAGLLARSQYPDGPATGHLDTGFSWFPCVYKRMLRCFQSFQVATTCLSCSPPKLNFPVTYLIFVYMENNHCHRVINQLQLINIIIIIIYLFIYLFIYLLLLLLLLSFPLLVVITALTLCPVFITH